MMSWSQFVAAIVLASFGNAGGALLIPSIARKQAQSRGLLAAYARRAGNSSEDSSMRAADYNYGLVLDAGSSGSRLHIFKWTLSKVVDLQEIEPSDEDEDLLRTEPGLSGYIDNPSEAGPAVLSMIDVARKYVPKTKWGESPLFVKATAGLRLMRSSATDPVLDAVREQLQNLEKCPFKFVSIEVISGEEEAGLAYLSSNYALGTLHSKSEHYGTLEMGGASLQVAFKPEGDINSHDFEFYIDGQREEIYGMSYMRFGVNEAIDRMFKFLAKEIVDQESVEASPPGGSPAPAPSSSELSGDREVSSPCHPKGHKELNSGVTFIGTGDYSACRKVVRKLMGLDVECLMPPCAMFGTYMPKATVPFNAYGGFFYGVNGLGLVGWKESKVITPAEIADATRSFCPKDIEAAVEASGKPEKYAKKYCFFGTYITESLSALGFSPSDKSITYRRKVSGDTLGWPIGAILYETQLMPLDLMPHKGMRGLCSPPQKFADNPNAQAKEHSHSAAHYAPSAAASMTVFALLLQLSRWA